MLRVGPLKRIDRSLLPYSLHSSAAKCSEAAKELEDMLKAASSVSEAACINEELARVSHTCLNAHVLHDCHAPLILLT
jgi:hypothetical protein